MKPLEGIIVLDFAQFLAGPSAAMRLADLGARVIKVERPDGGDKGRQLTFRNVMIDSDSILFHAINRNKESFTADLKNPADIIRVKNLIQKADVMIHNFRPGVMERIGLDYESVRVLNPRMVYGEVTGYGDAGHWRDKPGQDLLAQSRSGITWLTGSDGTPPTPVGLSIADLATGAHLAQGILACLVRRGVTGEGGRVQVSLLESVLDLQFELLTTYFNDNRRLPQRSSVNNANAYVAAPYGIYETADGYLALAMGSIIQLGELLACDALLAYPDPESWFTQRDEIKQILVDHLKMQSTTYWLSRLEPADYWCAEVLHWDQLEADEGFQVLQMIQQVDRGEGITLETTRCPIRIDSDLLTATKAAPRLGADTQRIIAEFKL